MKTLVFDIELSKAMALIYPSHRPQYIHASNIIRDQFMPCAAWKWLHEDKIHIATVLDDKKKFKEDYSDDSLVVKALYDAVEEADIVVGHNSDNFDLKHLNWMAIKHGLPPLPLKQQIDTLKVCRQVFKAPSNSLDELVKALIGDRKMDTSKGMHNRVAIGDAEAIAEMARYNIQDVKIQDAFYLKIRPWMRNHPNQIIKDPTGETVITCDKCNSPNVHRKRVRYLKNGRARVQYRCQEPECRTYFTGDMVK